MQAAQLTDLLLLYRNLNHRQPFLRVFLIPRSIDVASAGLPHNLVALLVDVAECFDKRLIEPFVWADMLNT